MSKVECCMGGGYLLFRNNGWYGWLVGTVKLEKVKTNQ